MHERSEGTCPASSRSKQESPHRFGDRMFSVGGPRELMRKAGSAAEDYRRAKELRYDVEDP